MKNGAGKLKVSSSIFKLRKSDEFVIPDGIVVLKPHDTIHKQTTDFGELLKAAHSSGADVNCKT